VFTDIGIDMEEKLQGAFHNAATGETIVRDLTDEELAQIPPLEEPTNE
jgi:hypothetical protein